MTSLPGGSVTFLFSDIEGSTRLLDGLGAEAYAEALAEHRRIMRKAFAAHDGFEVNTQGDAFFVAFPRAEGALAAAEQAQAALAAGPIRVRKAASVDATLAARLAGAAGVLAEEVGLEPDDEVIDAVRAVADGETYDLAYEEGRSLSLDEAVELALSVDSG